MKTVLLATPYLSQHFDAGHYFMSALSRLRVALVLWDYRREPCPTVKPDVLLALKGSPEVSRVAERTFWGERVCYWPDKLGRDPTTEEGLKHFDRLYTCLRPTPEGMTWLPSGWDPVVHTPWDGKQEQKNDRVVIGTAPERKAGFLRVLQPRLTFGNGWWDDPTLYQGHAYMPIYLHEMVAELRNTRVAINIHRDGDTGLNRRFFEMMACTFTITDLVPGVVEVLGADLAARVGFTDPHEAKNKLDFYLAHPEERRDLWEAERRAIAPYTYEKTVERILTDLQWDPLP